MSYEFKININKEEYETFVEHHTYCSLLQSYDWAKVKENWNSIYTGVYEGSTLVATGLVLVRPLPLSMSMFYLPRGPILDYENKDLLSFYFDELKKIAKKKHCLFIKIDPSIIYSTGHLHEETIYTDKALYDTYFNNILSIGAIHKGYNVDFDTTVQPRYNMVEYKDSFGMDFMSKKGKKNIKYAMKQNIEVVIGHQELLDDFEYVMKCTENRKGILLRTKEYYQLLLDTFKENAFIVLGYISIKNDLDTYKAKLETCLKDIENCPENAKKKLFTLNEQKSSFEKKINELSSYYEKYGDKTCVCGTLSICCGSSSEILYAGLNEDFKRYNGPYLIWYKTMEECFNKGCITSNMGGIEGTLTGGLVDFKEVFYPRIDEYIGEFDIPVNKLLYGLSQKAYTMLKPKH